MVVDMLSQASGSPTRKRGEVGEVEKKKGGGCGSVGVGWAQQ